MQSWLYPYPIRKTAVLNDLEVAYVDEGAGEQTLLFIHGLGSNLKGWWKTIEGLKSNFRCIALDLPGYGKSGQGDHPYGMRFFARAVHSFLLQLQLRDVTLVGHSMGGQIAVTTFLENGGDRINKLILLSPAGFETFSEQHIGWFEGIYRPEVLEQIPVDRIRGNFHLNFVQFPEDAEFMIDDRLTMRRNKEAFRHFCRLQAACVRSMLKEPIFDRLPEVTCPTLVLFGEEDQLIPNRLLHPMATPRDIAAQGTLRLPRGEVTYLSPCGHFPQWECSDEVNAAIRSF